MDLVLHGLLFSFALFLSLRVHLFLLPLWFVALDLRFTHHSPGSRLSFASHAHAHACFAFLSRALRITAHSFTRSTSRARIAHRGSLRILGSYRASSRFSSPLGSFCADLAVWITHSLWISVVRSSSFYLGPRITLGLSRFGCTLSRIGSLDLWSCFHGSDHLGSSSFISFVHSLDRGSLWIMDLPRFSVRTSRSFSLAHASLILRTCCWISGLLDGFALSRSGSSFGSRCLFSFQNNRIGSRSLGSCTLHSRTRCTSLSSAHNSLSGWFMVAPLSFFRFRLSLTPGSLVALVFGSLSGHTRTHAFTFLFAFCTLSSWSFLFRSLVSDRRFSFSGSVGSLDHSFSWIVFFHSSAFAVYWIVFVFSFCIRCLVYSLSTFTDLRFTFIGSPGSTDLRIVFCGCVLPLLRWFIVHSHRAFSHSVSCALHVRTPLHRARTGPHSRLHTRFAVYTGHASLHVTFSSPRFASPFAPLSWMDHSHKLGLHLFWIVCSHFPLGRSFRSGSDLITQFALFLSLHNGSQDGFLFIASRILFCRFHSFLLDLSSLWSLSRTFSLRLHVFWIFRFRLRSLALITVADSRSQFSRRSLRISSLASFSLDRLALCGSLRFAVCTLIVFARSALSRSHCADS